MNKKIFAFAVIVAMLASMFTLVQVNNAYSAKKPKTIKFTLDGKTVKIGYIATNGLEPYSTFLKQIIEPDLNEYAAKLGYDVKFEFVIADAAGYPNVHLEKVKAFKSMGIELIIGGGWSSQAAASLSYVNENGMLLFSHSSTSPLLAIPNDNLFRMAPTDLKQAPAIAEMLWSYGIKAVVFMQRGDAWGDGIYNAFVPLFEAKGGVVLDRIRYSAETADFSSYLEAAEDAAAAAILTYGADRVAVELISFQEAVIIVTQAEDYPTIYSLPWFGSDGTVFIQQLIDDAPTQAAHLGIYSTIATVPQSQKYSDLYDRYYAITNQPLGFYQAGLYDVAWVIAKGVLEAQSTQALDVIPLIPQICYDMWGASGWCRLDQNGDMYDANYDIWGYGGTPVQNVLYGCYDSVTGKVTWDTDALGYTPIGP
jgi:branched-chain amino acid transport system substrate-binding protein